MSEDFGAKQLTVDFSSEYVAVAVEIRWNLDGQVESVVATDTAVIVIEDPD